MGSITYTEYFRIIVATFTVIAWYLLSRRTGARWLRMTRLGKRLWVWYYILLFSVTYATIEALKQDNPLTSKNYVIAFAVTGLMVAALLRLDGDESTEPVYRVQLKGSPQKWRIQKLR